jgi:hypothetical protein
MHELMPFIDRFPESPFTDRDEERSRPGDSPTEPRLPERAGLEGLPATHRVIFRAMAVPGFPDELLVGPIRITQTQGPVRTQVTSVRQEPGLRPTFYKHMEARTVGGGEFLTVAERDVVVTRDLGDLMATCHSAALAAVGLVAAVLDERVAQEILASDLLVFDEKRAGVIGAADHVPDVRTFQSANAMLEPHTRALAEIGASADVETESRLLLGARWYLRAAQQGPVADAIVFFWIALEALAKPLYGDRLTSEERSRSDVAWVELAVAAAGLDPSALEPSIGRCAGVRAEIVHGGRTQPAELRPAYYMLEQLTRLLLRDRLGIGEVGWPLAPDISNLRDPYQSEAERMHRDPETIWE